MLDIRLIKLDNRYLAIENVNGQQHRISTETLVDAYSAFAPYEQSAINNRLFAASLEKVASRMKDGMCLWLCFNSDVPNCGAWWFAQMGLVHGIGSDTGTDFEILTCGASKDGWYMAISMFTYHYEEVMESRRRLINEGASIPPDGIV